MLLRLGWTHERVRVPYLLGTGLLVAAGAASALRGDLPASGLLAVLQDLFLLAWAAALANFARRPDGLRFLVDSWALTASCWGVGLLVAAGPSLLAGGTGGGTGPARATFTFGDENAAGFYFVLSMLVIVAARRPRRRSLRIVALACLALATVGSGSLGAISGLLAGVAVAVVLGRQRSAWGGRLRWLLPSRCRSVSARSFSSASGTTSSRPPMTVATRSCATRWVAATRAALRGPSSRARPTSCGGPRTRGDVVRSRPRKRCDRRRRPTRRKPTTTGSQLSSRGGSSAVLGSCCWWPRSVSGRRGRGTCAGWHPVSAAAVPAPQFVVGALATATIFSLTHEVLHDRSLCGRSFGLAGGLRHLGALAPLDRAWGRVHEGSGDGGGWLRRLPPVCGSLLDAGAEVTGVDVFTDYYDR